MSTDLDRISVLAEAARYGVVTHNDAPRPRPRERVQAQAARFTVVLPNDASRPRAQERARAEDTPPPWSYRQYHAARKHRDAVLGHALAAAIAFVGRFVRRARERYEQRRFATLTYEALRGLDDRTLHDLGLDRSEMTSVAAEVSAAAEYSRVRTKLSSHLPFA